MSRIRVQFARMAEAERAFQAAYEALHDELSDLDGQLRTHLDAWEGTAQRAYQGAYEEWQAAADDMAAALADLRRAIEHAHRNFRGAQAANLTMWRRR
jgi:early secretory antigenic target protein ESAT-6